MILHPPRSGSPDPFWANVISMSNAQGLNNGTALRDDKHLRSWTSVSASKTSTAVPGPFGGSSFLFAPASSDRWETADSADFNFGTGDFTIESWIYPTGAGAFRRILSQQSTSPVNAWFMRQSNTNKLDCAALNAGATVISLASTTSLTASAWNFGSWTRSGNNFYVHLNGVMEASGSSASALPDVPQIITLGAIFDGVLAELWAGNIGPWRITKAARYGSGNYTIPSGPFPTFGP